jgi:hypothetical protein
VVAGRNTAAANSVWPAARHLRAQPTSETSEARLSGAEGDRLCRLAPRQGSRQPDAGAPICRGVSGPAPLPGIGKRSTGSGIFVPVTGARPPDLRLQPSSGHSTGHGRQRRSWGAARPEGTERSIECPGWRRPRPRVRSAGPIFEAKSGFHADAHRAAAAGRSNRNGWQRRPWGAARPEGIESFAESPGWRRPRPLVWSAGPIFEAKSGFHADAHRAAATGRHNRSHGRRQQRACRIPIQ